MRCAGVLVVVVFGVMMAGAQQRGDSPNRPSQAGQGEEQQFLFYEAVNLTAGEQDLSRIDIPYRIDEQFFIAVRNTDRSLLFPFRRRGEILIELYDKKGISKARDIHRFEAGAENTEPRFDVKSWHTGISSFTVAPGEYTIVVEVDDLESERKFLDRSRTITAKKFDDGTLQTSSTMFVETKPEGNFSPVAFGGNLSFGTQAALLFQLHSTKLTDEPVRVEYSISTQEFLYKDPELILKDTLELKPDAKSNLMLKSQDARYPYEPSGENASPNTALLVVPLHTEKLPLRPLRLEMKVRQGELETSVNLPFRMVWPEMPQSLRDIDFAIEVLRHITRESELDSITSGTRDTRLEHLEQFWKKKDQTPDTQYNEVMVEYYRRVDHTMRAFGSIRGGDGYKTDRGRIYILYGPPTKTERTLDPSAGFQEIWTYEKQSKKFVFLDQSKSGNYTLVSTQNL